MGMPDWTLPDTLRAPPYNTGWMPASTRTATTSACSRESLYPCQVSVMLPEDVGTQLEVGCDDFGMMRLRRLRRVFFGVWELERETLKSAAKCRKIAARSR